jgi:hypothetical protein
VISGNVHEFEVEDFYVVLTVYVGRGVGFGCGRRRVGFFH